jgi:predicted nuclease of predicted toxin-antitoxin system
MKLKLDENLGHAIHELFKGHGHDAASVFDQQMTSATDRNLIEACKREGRCLVTLDLDFGNPLLFNPPTVRA